MTPNITNVEAADAALQLFDFLRLAPKGWPLFERLYGQPFDIMRFTPDDYKYVPYKKYSVDEGWELDLGQGWRMKVSPYNYNYYASGMVKEYRKYRITFYFDGVWCGHHYFTVKHGRIPQQAMVPEDAEVVWDRIFEQIKRRAAITLREHKKYLARPVFYDILETELNIKIRKKK